MLKKIRLLFMSMQTKRRFAKAIQGCFKNVDWSSQYFNCGNSSMVDKNGNNRFYAAPEIDKAIKKLNRILNLL